MKIMNVQIILAIALFGNVLLQGMTPVKRAPRTGRIPTQTKIPKPNPVDMPFPQSSESLSRDGVEYQPGESTVPLGNRKTDLLSDARFSEADDTPVGRYVRNWYRNIMAKLFGGVPPTSKPVETARETVAPSPFAAGGQKRQYSSSQHSSTRQIPESFSPSLKSRLPWTNEHKIEKMFTELYDNPGIILYPTSNVYRFEDLVKESGYNPVNRFIQGQPSLFAKILTEFVERNKKSTNLIGTSSIERFFYTTRARVRPDELEEMSALLTGAMQFLQRAPEKHSKLASFIEFSEQVLEWNRFLNNIGFSISIGLRLDRLEELCDLGIIYADQQLTIDNLEKNPKRLLIGKHDKYRNWSNKPTTAEYVINLLKAAGFPGLGASQQYNHSQSLAGRDRLIKLLGIKSSNPSAAEIKKAYYSFVKLAHTDINSVSPLSKKLKEEVNPAWDDYNRELAAEKQNRE